MKQDKTLFERFLEQYEKDNREKERPLHDELQRLRHDVAALSLKYCELVEEFDEYKLKYPAKEKDE